MTLGLEKEKLKDIIGDCFKKNSDILMGIDDPEVIQLKDVIVDAFIDAMDRNNQKMHKDLEKIIETVERMNALARGF